MTFHVLLTDHASDDLAALTRFLRQNDSVAKAREVVRRIRTVAETLSQHPERGRVPPELTATGIADYREILTPPYRLVYRVIDQSVVVILIADGRRDLASLLFTRLLR